MKPSVLSATFCSALSEKVNLHGFAPAVQIGEPPAAEGSTEIVPRSKRLGRSRIAGSSLSG